MSLRRDGRVHATAAHAAYRNLALDALATYRLTRLATADIISEPVRLAVVRSTGAPVPDADLTAREIVDELDDPPKLATLVTCRWCAGLWIAGAVTVARMCFPRYWDPAARALALSASAVLLARLETD
jgi:hypothetical protein